MLRSIGVESMLLAGCFLFIVVHNYLNLLGWLLGRQRFASVPLVGGLLGACAVLTQDVIPVTLFWLPIVLDPTLGVLVVVALLSRARQTS